GVAPVEPRPATQTIEAQDDEPVSDELHDFGPEHTNETPREKPPSTDPLWSGADDAAPASEEVFPTITDSRRDPNATRTIEVEPSASAAPSAEEAPASSGIDSSPTMTEVRAKYEASFSSVPSEPGEGVIVAGRFRVERRD